MYTFWGTLCIYYKSFPLLCHLFFLLLPQSMYKFTVCLSETSQLFSKKKTVRQTQQEQGRDELGENPKREEQKLSEADRDWGIGESYRERKVLESFFCVHNLRYLSLHKSVHYYELNLPASSRLINFCVFFQMVFTTPN